MIYYYTYVAKNIKYNQSLSPEVLKVFYYYDNDYVIVSDTLFFLST